jgi:dienelactone hydrolase
MRALFLLPALLLGAGCASDSVVLSPAPAASALPASGVIAFDTAGSLNRSARGRNFVLGAPVPVSGDLQLPPGGGPFPAVVLAHGCGGNRNVERAWGPTLRGWGYATLVLDSFGPRGIQEVCTNGRTLMPLQRVPDAYGALRMLAAHPRVDPKRIVLMGFSHGGALTMLAATAWARETFAPAGQPAFRAFVPFYPNCNAVFPERDRVSAPVRIHTGELDDWTPAKPCADLATVLKASGQDVAINVYAGAHHAFDQAQRQIYLPKVGNGADCFPKLPSLLGPFPVGAVPGAPPACVKRGATIGPHPGAAVQARSNLRAQLDELIK